MAAITTRSTAGTGATVAGVPLTNAQLDANFINLNTAKAELGTPTAGGVTYGNGTTIAYTAVGTAGQVLTSAAAGTPTWTTITTSAGGSNTQLQYNNSGAFAGSANMTFNGTSLSLTNGATIQGLTIGKGIGGYSTNTALGVSTLNTAGVSQYNTAVGYQTLVNNSTGSFNTGVGGSVFTGYSTGSYNSALGYQALTSITSGTSNIGIGHFAGYSINTGSNNTIIGSVAGTADLANTVIIAAGSTERMRIDSSGNVGIGTTSPTYKLDINGANLGTTAGNQSNIARLFSGSGNNDFLEITNTRTASGTAWTTAGFRFQQKIDSTWMAWQQFNGGADGGIVWGAGTTTSSAIGVTEKMRLDASGRLSIGTVSSDSLLRVAGQIESTVTGYKFPNGTVQTTAGVSTGKAIAMAMIFGG